MKYIALILIVIFSQGCGALVYTDGNSRGHKAGDRAPSEMYFAAVRYDIKKLGTVTRKSTPWGWKIFGTSIFLLDLPISACFDIQMLPFIAFAHLFRGEEPEKPEEDIAEVVLR